MTQNIIVVFIVAAAALYAVWRWMPSAWRRAAAGRLASGSQRAGLVDEERARKLADSLSKTSGCGSCDSCGSCGTGSKASQAGSKPAEATVQPPKPRART